MKYVKNVEEIYNILILKFIFFYKHMIYNDIIQILT